MERISIPSFGFAAKSYSLLTKPGILMGNAITTAAGFALGAKGHFDGWLFLATVFGISCIIGSACVFNNYIDRIADGKMKRTKNRALVKGTIPVSGAIAFALLLGLIGSLCLFYFVNLVALGAGLFGFFVYVVLYSFSKYRSMHGTLIGSVAGALPPVVGYAAASGRLDLGAWILFSMVVLWQMPHFFAIAIYRIDDYAAASIPVLPIQKGIQKAKVHMLFYVIAFLLSCLLLPLSGYVSYGFAVLATLLAGGWGWLCVRGFECENDSIWARKMFLFSLLVIMGLCAAIPLCVVV
jgi:protoheme IX farnesyltransferase